MQSWINLFTVLDKLTFSLKECHYTFICLRKAKTEYFLHIICGKRLKTGYSPCCACAILFVLVDYYLSFPWFPIRLRNIRAILYLLIQGVGIHSFEEIFNDL